MKKIKLIPLILKKNLTKNYGLNVMTAIMNSNNGLQIYIMVKFGVLIVATKKYAEK